MDLDLHTELAAWQRFLRAEGKSAQTVKSYSDGVRRYLHWCDEHDQPPVLDRRQVVAFVEHLLANGAQPATARSRQLALRRFSAWLLDEDLTDTDPLAGLRPPKLDSKVVEPLTDDELRALLRACNGKTLRDRRDLAVVRLMLETGLRAGEAASLLLADVDTASGQAIVRRGKGGKGRLVPFGPQTAVALDRYLRLRRDHLLAGTEALWLGDRGKPFTYDGLHKTLRWRAQLAGIERFHPHLLRHTAAHRWLAAGGSEAGLMAVAGWTRPDMLLRYTRAQASARAADEARRLNLGDL